MRKLVLLTMTVVVLAAAGFVVFRPGRSPRPSPVHARDQGPTRPDPDPPRVQDVTGARYCGTDELTLSARSSKTQYASGEDVAFSVDVTNSSRKPCANVADWTMTIRDAQGTFVVSLLSSYVCEGVCPPFTTQRRAGAMTLHWDQRDFNQQPVKNGSYSAEVTVEGGGHRYGPAATNEFQVG